ncbi:hypothetical protein KC660_04445 [Candidatus Dojkabacteria bacterium]|uniref:ACT domain-containing protein n=1 Tax=Candidatus Dojkabacteria bacterium TaxID=2099670 RepID=A0A955L425_9BACT|nr:hypothetical protein [Candidatus Dojkabacteria bacterium]
MDKVIILVKAKDSQVLLSKIITILRQSLIETDSINSTKASNNTVNIIISLQVSDRNKLNMLIGSLNNIVEVVNVKLLQPENSIQLEAFIIKSKSQPVMDASMISRVAKQDYGYLIYGCSDSKSIDELILDLGVNIIEIARTGITVIEKPLVNKPTQVYNEPQSPAPPKPTIDI